jgi:transposase
MSISDEDLGRLLADVDLDGWVTLADAAETAGVSKSALRAWFRNDEIPARIEDGPHGPQRLVPLDAVLERARETAGHARGRRRRPQDADDTVRDLVGALMDQLVTARAEVADLRRRVELLEHPH